MYLAVFALKVELPLKVTPLLPSASYKTGVSEKSELLLKVPDVVIVGSALILFKEKVITVSTTAYSMYCS